MQNYFQIPGMAELAGVVLLDALHEQGPHIPQKPGIVGTLNYETRIFRDLELFLNLFLLCEKLK